MGSHLPLRGGGGPRPRLMRPSAGFARPLAFGIGRGFRGFGGECVCRLIVRSHTRLWRYCTGKVTKESRRSSSNMKFCHVRGRSVFVQRKGALQDLGRDEKRHATPRLLRAFRGSRGTIVCYIREDGSMKGNCCFALCVQQYVGVAVRKACACAPYVAHNRRCVPLQVGVPRGRWCTC